MTGANASSVPSGNRVRDVVVNRVQLGAATLGTIERQYRVRIADGSYWYDARSSLFGAEGQPPLGFFVAELEIGGPLRADASNGDTDVVVNGRILTRIEVAFLERYFPVYEGRYWLEANGDAGVEGSTDVLFNLLTVVRSASGGGSDGFYSNSLIDSASNSQGGCSYISVDGTTYTSGCG